MPFFAFNGHRTKPIRPEVEFPIRHGEETIAALSTDEFFPDQIYVDLLREGAAIIFGNGRPDIAHSAKVDGQSFLVRYKGKAIRVDYHPDEQISLGE